MTDIRSRSLIGAGIVAVVAAAAIVLWGLVPLPSFAPLGDDPVPALPGTIAYLHGGYGDEPACLEVVTASSPEGRSLACWDGRIERWPDQVAWTADGLVVVTLYGERGPTYEAVDPADGSVVVAGTWSTVAGEPVPMEGFGEDSPDIEVGYDDGRIKVEVSTDGHGVTVIDAEAPRSYRFWNQVRSPDGGWVMMLDSEDRLVIAPADGSAPARLVSDDARQPAWWVDGSASRIVQLPGT